MPAFCFADSVIKSEKKLGVIHQIFNLNKLIKPL